MNTLFERTLRRRFRQKGEIAWLRVSFLRRLFYLSKASPCSLSPAQMGKNTTPAKYTHTRRLTRRFSPQPAEDVYAKNLLVVELLHHGRGTTKSSYKKTCAKNHWIAKPDPKLQKTKKPRQKCLTLDAKQNRLRRRARSCIANDNKTTQTSATLRTTMCYSILQHFCLYYKMLQCKFRSTKCCRKTISPPH